MDNKTAFTNYIEKRQKEYKKKHLKPVITPQSEEETDKQYRAYLSMTINSYHTKKGGRYPRKVYGYL